MSKNYVTKLDWGFFLNYQIIVNGNMQTDNFFYIFPKELRNSCMIHQR